MEYYLFDSCRWGIIIAIVVETVVLLGWAFGRGRVRREILLAGPVIVILFLGLDKLVETDREQLERLSRQIVQAAEDEDAGTIINLLSDNFMYADLYDKESASREIAAKLAKPLISKNRITKLLVTSAGENTGEVELTILTTLDPRSEYIGVSLVKTRWRFEYVRDYAKQYQVGNIAMLSLNNGKPVDPFRFRGDI